MTIQIIRYSENIPEGNNNIFYSHINSPRALDDFDINCIDLSNEGLWRSKELYFTGSIDSKPDLHTLSLMVSNMQKSIAIYIFPQNITYTYNNKSTSNKFHTPIKDVLDAIMEKSICVALPENVSEPTIAFEKTTSYINGHSFEADFHFCTLCEPITKSERSEKATTVQLADDVYATTLSFENGDDKLVYFAKSLFGREEKEPIPEWVKSIRFRDDEFQTNRIAEKENEIYLANMEIKDAKNRINENIRIKSILYTNGNELVEVVFEILEAVLDYDLSGFVDKKEADFIIKKPTCTFIGEIKGVTSNVKREHVTQVELHCNGYLDELFEKNIEENVKQLLIINPFRNKPVNDREPIHDTQINLASRYGCLIIETNTLLRLYEKFCMGEISTEECFELFREKTGLLRICDISPDK